MIPKTMTGRAFAVLWLLCGFSLLVFAYVQQDLHDMPVVLVWLLVFLAFPVGLIAAPVVGAAWSSLATSFGLVYHPFWHSLPFWVVLVSLGYLQWFVVVPNLWRRLSRARTGA
jgi:hypothetical protein